MAMVSPKTIVITSLPARSSSQSTVLTQRPKMSTMQAVASSLPFAITEGLGIHGEPKKRKRLTNLSPEERMMRRKLKNRVAAQTARDRKKAKMEELEQLLTVIEEENKRLQDENEALKAKTGELSHENCQLKERLGVIGNAVDDKKVVSLVESPESAVLATPQPQEQTRTEMKPTLSPTAPKNSALTWLQMMLTFSLVSCLTSLKSLRTTAATTAHPQRPLVRRRRNLHLHQHRPLHRAPPFLMWWGPQQQNWRPSMNSSTSTMST